MDRKPFPIVAAAGLTALALAGCGPGAPTPPPAPPKRDGLEAGYVASPQVTALQAQDGQVRLSGVAAPNAMVRLATPGGQAMQAHADGQGHWTLLTPAGSEPAIYGLSQNVDGRTVQAQGYVLVAPDGQGVLLRAGAGAQTLGAEPEAGVTAFDIDRDGGAVVSGRGPAGASVSARIDGHKLGEGRVDEDGRFSLALSGPVPPGSHSLKVFGDQLDASLVVDARPAAPLTSGPFRATPVPAGLRVDWMTPGGGVQTTLVIRQAALMGGLARRDLP